MHFIYFRTGMKLLFRIFLSFSYLLLGFSSNTEAHALEDCMMFSPARSVTHAIYIVPPFKVCDGLPVLTYHVPELEYNYERVYEERDEETTSTHTVKKKKSSDNKDYFTSFYSTSSKYFHYFPDKGLSIGRHYSFLSLSRTIAFGVIRI